MSVQVKTEYTPEDLLTMEGEPYELVNGALEERHVGVLSDLIAGRLATTPAAQIFSQAISARRIDVAVKPLPCTRGNGDFFFADLLPRFLAPKLRALKPHTAGIHKGCARPDLPANK